MRPAAPGPRLSSGRLRVDAARAIAKLREYQLPDRSAWIVEGVRAAVASGAERVEVDGDSNDVWLSWRGPAWPREVLPRLLDELVSPEPSRDAQHLRLLATAINSGLGLDPAYIDVFSVDPAGAATVVRYTPEILEMPGDDDEEPALRQLEVRLADRPRKAPAPGMHLHLRRRAGLETLGTFLRGAKPVEIDVAKSACRDAPIPIDVGGETLGRERGLGDLVRVELGDGLDGFLALTDPSLATADRPVAEIAERGGVISRHLLDLGLPPGWRPTPLRLYVDGPRMPVNASRSAVRRDAFPVADAERKAKTLVGPLVERVIAELEDPATSGDRRDLLIDAVLALLASVTVGPSWPAKIRDLSMPLAALARLEIVKNAVGREVPVSTRWSPNVVHDGRDPLDPELEPWLSDVLWTPPGSPAARLAEGAAIDQRSLRDRLKRARKRLKNQRRFFSRGNRELSLRRQRFDWIRAAIGAPVAGSAIADELVSGVSGELVLARRGTAEVTLVYEGRPLETVELDTAALGSADLAFRARIEHPQLQAADSYRQARRDDAFTRAINAVAATAVRAIEVLALAAGASASGHLPEGYDIEDRADYPDIRASMFRAASILAVKVGGSLERSPLLDAPAWPIGGGRRASIAELRALDVVGVSLGPFEVAGRTVVRATLDERRLLAQLVGGHALVVYYDPMRVVLGRGDFAARAVRDLVTGPGVAALAIREEGQRGAIAWGARTSSVTAYHGGAPIGLAHVDPVLTDRQIAIDCDHLVPSETWAGLVNPEHLERIAADWERKLARAVARALTGEIVADLSFNRTTTLDRGAGLALCRALANGPDSPAGLLGDELVEALRDAPLCHVHGEVMPISPRQLAERFPKSIPILTNGAVAPVDGFTPLVVSDIIEARAIGQLTGRPTHVAADQLERKRAEIARARDRARFLSTPAIPLPEPGPRDVALETADLAGVVRLGRGDTTGQTMIEVEVRIDGRSLARISEPGPPITAVVEAPASMADESFSDVTGRGRTAILSRVRRLADALLWKRLSDGNEAALVDDPLVCALATAMLEGSEIGARDRRRLRELAAFPTVQGPRASIEQAELLGLVRIASWGGQWLEPGDGAEAESLDLPVLAVGADEAGAALRALVDALATEGVIDETRAVGKLQVSRAMARGILSRPVIGGSRPEVTRDLDALGQDGRLLGAGEIALVPGDRSRVLVHELGVFVGEIEVAVLPPVHVAVEAPDLVDRIGKQIQSSILAARVQRAAAALVERLLAPKDNGVELPDWVDRGLVAAVLSGAVEPDAIAGRPIFSTAGGDRVDIGALREQARLFGDVWYVTSAPQTAPLDPRRLVVVLDELAAPHVGETTVALIEASSELALDAEARANRDREPLAELTLPGPVILGALDIVELEGDGLTAPRGRVAVLAPDAASLRGVSLHREMRPLGTADDPCQWPTYAVVDDARLTPDRTFSQAELDEAFREVLRAVQRTTEAALARRSAVPRGALASRVIWRLDDDQPEGVGRGRLWLPDTWQTGVVTAEHAGGLLRHHPVTESGAPLPVSGTLMIAGPPGLDIESAIDRAARRAYPDLVRAARLLDRDTDLATAHAVLALDAQLLEPGDLDDLEIACFEPGPLDASGLAELLAGSPRAGGPRLIDDGSVVAQVIGSLLDIDVSNPAAAHPLPLAGGDDPGELEKDAKPDAEPDEPGHPLAGLAQAVAAALAEAGVRHGFDAVRVADDQTDLVDVRDRVVTLAANARLAAVESARQASSPWAPELVDALVAHAITAMTAALHLTEGEQMHAFERLLMRGNARRG